MSTSLFNTLRVLHTSEPSSVLTALCPGPSGMAQYGRKTATPRDPKSKTLAHKSPTCSETGLRCLFIDMYKLASSSPQIRQNHDLIKPSLDYKTLQNHPQQLPQRDRPGIAHRYCSSAARPSTLYPPALQRFDLVTLVLRPILGIRLVLAVIRAFVKLDLAVGIGAAPAEGLVSCWKLIASCLLVAFRGLCVLLGLAALHLEEVDCPVRLVSGGFLD